ncbi:hypothetical protein GQ44DRAFT_654491 [Phaeosphaeriaceae sp. PMI808]|nr:hypothetical protein GQ44DRAFT_654491 [Phaeosphaeriaceae sp. PMI808]
MFRIRPALARPSPRWSGAGTCRPRMESRCSISDSSKIKRKLSPSRAPRLKEHWTPDKIVTSDEYPLTLAMREMMHPHMAARPVKKQADVLSANTVSDGHIRTQLVSPGLCDDALEYSRHLLAKHKGCDILDINPGACLWSQKLHAFLNPRTHILLEPSPDLFREYLDPLLEAPNSRYRLATKDPLSLSTYRDLVNEGAFTHQTRVDPADTTAQEPNNTLLVTGTLIWDPRLPGMGFDSMAKQLYHHFASAAWTNDLFHAYGPVHTLLWVQSDDFAPIVPKAIAGMQKASRLMDMTQTVTMIVGSKRVVRATGKATISREPQFEIESAIRALQAGRELGLDILPHRRDITYDMVADINKASADAGISHKDLMRAEFMPDFLRDRLLAGKSLTGIVPQKLIENIQLEKNITSEYPEITLYPFRIPPKDMKKSYKGHPAEQTMHTFTKMRSALRHGLIKKQAIEATVDIGEKLYLLECKTLRMQEGSEKEAAIKEIENLDNAWDQAVMGLDQNIQTAPLAELDDRINLRHPPEPRIQWDKRPFEPLMSHPSEAWPVNRLSLLYASPRPKPMVDWADLITDFASGLYAESSRSVLYSLDSMQHGLSDIVNNCPSLRDPSKGGRMLLKHLRVRLLTMEMIYELTSAYQAWPFKAPGSDHSMYFRNKAKLGGVLKRWHMTHLLLDNDEVRGGCMQVN